ncbi:hypothetical protein DU19_0837 [Chlamydia muridarum]|nr:hypothetical protein DU17_0839 [Chlamydia muridarum]KDU81781.1 hypothetical protein DU18_0837 [Chlamydia muridarum]KDU82802.1 hypothetical protein DU19_0837 [Chlamydia muridarum]KDU83736.1 hypothetical protein DU20_0837 [Chlamydia muridarum]KDU84054.1 hypothetical protein DU21_0839 [Chlamydia muridarum]
MDYFSSSGLPMSVFSLLLRIRPCSIEKASFKEKSFSNR